MVTNRWDMLEGVLVIIFQPSRVLALGPALMLSSVGNRMKGAYSVWPIVNKPQSKALGWQPLFLKNAMGKRSNFQIFWVQFWNPFFGLKFRTLERKKTRKCHQNWPQNWLPKPDQKFKYFSNALPPSRAKRLPTQGPQK